MSQITVAALQLAFTDCVEDNIAAVTELVRTGALVAAAETVAGPLD